MTEQKKTLLEQTHQNWFNLVLDENPPLNIIESIVAKDVMGFGTTLEEKIFGLEAAKQLLHLGKEQRKYLKGFKFKEKEILRRIIGSNDVAVYVDELLLSYTLDGIVNNLPLRITTVLNYTEQSWKVTHWHGSLAVETEEGDTWHADELKLKNEKLQLLVDQRTAELKQTIADLKATQTQLIQSEKMASLGELTAGIAHEIQNPLNFVNNFSEVSSELIDEMNEEIEKGDFEEVKAISVDIKQNLGKISHHGKRADGIVKGMLQHSRNSSGQKEPTDINALADEYLRLAYHGLRAKDQSFNAELVTDFDRSIDTVNVVPQDIGRVILNLLTNAFHAVKEKASLTKNPESKEYKPTVSVSSKRDSKAVFISVTDNGNGIPESVKSKIFQPFFTTKPTGQGTGLGLSMSYDIMTKGHGGELTVETKEGKGTTFSVVLPIAGSAN